MKELDRERENYIRGMNRFLAYFFASIGVVCQGFMISRMMPHSKDLYDYLLLIGWPLVISAYLVIILKQIKRQNQTDVLKAKRTTTRLCMLMAVTAYLSITIANYF